MTQTTKPKSRKLTVYLTDPQAASAEYLARMAAFVSSYHPYDWPVSQLDQAWLVEIADGNRVAALVWFTQFLGDRVIECHACVDPAYRSRWLTRRVLTRLFSIPETLGAKAVVAQITSPQIERIWRQLNFRIVPAANLAVLNLREDSHG